MRTRRTFKLNEKREIAENVVQNKLDVKKVKDKSGNLIHPSSIETWVNLYLLGKLGNKKISVTPSEAPKNPWIKKANTQEILKQKLNEAMSQSIDLEIEVMELKERLGVIEKSRRYPNTNSPAIEKHANN